MGPTADITGLLVAVSNGRGCRTRLIEAVYDGLRRLARGYLRASVRTIHFRPRRSSTTPSSRWSINAGFGGTTGPVLRDRAHQMRRIRSSARAHRRSSAARQQGAAVGRRCGIQSARRRCPCARRGAPEAVGKLSSPEPTRGAAFRRAHRRGDGSCPWRRAHHGEADWAVARAWLSREIRGQPA